MDHHGAMLVAALDLMGKRKIIKSHEKCPACNGSGLALNCYTGEPDSCRECYGDGVVRARDDRGRFVGNSKEFRP